MADKTGYNTRQRGEILAFLQKNPSRHLTIDDITRAMSDMGINVGKTTVYRYMDKLENEGRVKKYFISNSKSACYEYTASHHACRTHYHFKCTECDILFHIDCELMDKAYEHIQAHHGFSVENTKTVIYGLCSKCMAKREVKK